MAFHGFVFVENGFITFDFASRTGLSADNLMIKNDCLQH